MMQAPKPKKIPYILEQHNHSRTDNYYWLRDDSRTNKEMLSYLESENEYADQWFSSRKPYSDEIADELIQQIPDEEKRKKAHYVISTDQSIEGTEKEVALMVDKFKKIKTEAWIKHYSN